MRFQQGYKNTERYVQEKSLGLVITDGDGEILVRVYAFDDPGRLGANVLDSISTESKPERERFASSSSFSSDNVHNNFHAPDRIVRLFTIEFQEKRFGFLVNFLIVLDLLVRVVRMHDTVGAEAARLNDLDGCVSTREELVNATRTRTRMENGRSSVARLSPRARRSHVSTGGKRERQQCNAYCEWQPSTQHMCQRSKRNIRQTKSALDYMNTNWEFVRKCGSASSDDNCSREASSHVRQHSISNGHHAEYVCFELTDDSLNAGNE